MRTTVAIITRCSRGRYNGTSAPVALFALGRVVAVGHANAIPGTEARFEGTHAIKHVT